MPQHIYLNGKHIEGGFNTWMGLIWITQVWVQSHLTPSVPFCMAAVLHGRPGLGPECEPSRRKQSMTRKIKVLWTSQGFWNTNPHVHQRSVDRVMEAQTQAEYDPHGWAYLHADNTKCHAGAGRAPRGHKVHLHRFFSPFQAQKTRVSYGYQNEITLFPRQLENLIQTAPKLTVLGRA